MSRTTPAKEGQRCQNRPFFFWKGGGVLDIREGQRFKIDRFFLGGFLTLGKVNCHRHGLGVGAKIDRFFGEGGSDLKVAKTN